MMRDTSMSQPGGEQTRTWTEIDELSRGYIILTAWATLMGELKRHHRHVLYLIYSSTYSAIDPTET